jgi:signal peptidase I
VILNTGQFGTVKVWIMKRLIGMPGDTLEGKIEDGKSVIYLNGEKLNEPYKNLVEIAVVRKNNTKLGTRIYCPELRKDENLEILGIISRYRKEDIFKITLGPDEVWVMGDCRETAHDSRNVGPVKISHIAAKVFLKRIKEEPYSEHYKGILTEGDAVAASTHNRPLSKPEELNLDNSKNIDTMPSIFTIVFNTFRRYLKSHPF